MHLKIRFIDMCTLMRIVILLLEPFTDRLQGGRSQCETVARERRWREWREWIGGEVCRSRSHQGGDRRSDRLSDGCGRGDEGERGEKGAAPSHSQSQWGRVDM